MENSLTLIDAGLNTDDCWNSLQMTLKDHDYTLTDITGILLTHHHTRPYWFSQPSCIYPFHSRIRPSLCHTCTEKRPRIYENESRVF